jgi:5-methylcytosine-specific restriction endonuclease McrA
MIQTTLGIDGLTTEGSQCTKKPKAPKYREIANLLERQGHKCALTGRKLTPEIANIDHIIPLAKGGTHSIENLQIVHKDVNRAKNLMLLHEFIALCQEVADYSKGTPTVD